MLHTILTITIVVVYCEIMWKAVVKGDRPYVYMRQFIRFLSWLNYGIALSFASPYSLIIGSICNLYELVIYQKRYEQLQTNDKGS